MVKFSTLASFLSCSLVASNCEVILLDATNAAHRFDGIGALSAGASSRLLWDYNDAARTEILDLLFKPNYGASLHILKVEIGGDTQSTDGTEPSHRHSRNDLDCSRGYESWLLVEAKKRNPDILTYGLSWGVPGWVGNGTYYSSDNVQYQLDWMICMRDKFNVVIDYLGIWNEKQWGNVAYIKQLRSTLNQAGFTKTEIIMIDGGDDTNFYSSMESDKVFRDSFTGVGKHYPCNLSIPEVQRYGKLFWASEEASVPATWSGAGCWGRMLNQNYIRMNMTASIAWSLIWSAYTNLDCFGNGLLYAFQPWSGKYSVNSPVWITAHTTQFVKPGWHYLQPGSGLLSNGGTYVTMVDGRGNFTLILETLVGRCMYHDGCFHDHEPAPEQLVTFKLTHNLQVSKLAAWQSTQDQQFERIQDIVVGDDGTFSINVIKDSVLTITTHGNAKHQSKAAGKQVPSSTDSGETAPFPLPFKEDFSAYPKPVTGVMATYFADQAGSWEASDGVLRQVVLEPPGSNQWSCNSEPFTQIGDTNWTDYSLTARARSLASKTLSQGESFVAICVRMPLFQGFSCGDIPGYCLRLNETGWILASREYYLNTRIIASGSNSKLIPGKWHQLSLSSSGTQVTAAIDGQLLGAVRSTVSDRGQVALQSGWHEAEFDDIQIEPLAPVPPSPTVFKQISYWSWSWSEDTCTPDPKRSVGLPRNTYTGYVGMRVRVRRPVHLKSIGRWRNDGDNQTHGLHLIKGAIGWESWLRPEVPPDDDGFAYVNLDLQLSPGIYDVLSQESDGGDVWLDQGGFFKEADWVEVLGSVSGKDPLSLTVNSTRAVFGPVNLRLKSDDNLIERLI